MSVEAQLAALLPLLVEVLAREPALVAGLEARPVAIEVNGQTDVALAAANPAVRELDELDQTSQDVAIEIARGLDKDRWFLFAHISE